MRRTESWPSICRGWAAERVFGTTCAVLGIFLSISHGEHEEPRRFIVLVQRALSERIIGLAIDVHRTLAPGLLSRSMRNAFAWNWPGLAYI